MTVNQMVQFLRLSLDIPDADNLDPDTVYDPLLLQMTDEELLLFLNTALSQGEFSDPIWGDIPPLEEVPQKSINRLTLFAKRSLFFSLATRAAPKVDLGADNNNYLKQSQRFDHYMKLIEAVDNELKRQDVADEDGGGGTGGYVMTYDTTVVERYHTNYNKQKRPIPTVRVRVVNVLEDSIEITWRNSYISKFFSYRIWTSENPILDLFDRITQRIAKDAKLVFTTKNPHENSYRIKDVDTLKVFYVVVGVTTMEGLTGYSQIMYEPEEDLEDIEEPDEDEVIEP